MFKEKIYCGCDIGSQRIKSSLVRTKKKSAELLAVHETRTRGLQKAAVNDLGELSDSVRSCLKALMKKGSQRIKDIRLGIGGHLIESRLSNAIMPLVDKGNKIIVTNDVKRINKQASLLGTDIEDQVLHEFAQNYIVDENHGVTNPVGLYGRKLGTNFLLIVSRNNLLNNVTKAVHHAGFEVMAVSFSSLSACEAVLREDQRKKGCVLIDIGSSTTDILIFKNGYLRELEIIPLGGDNITGALMQSLKLPFSLAEEIKKSYASVQVDEVCPQGEILIKQEAKYLTIYREDVCRCIETEIVKLLECIEGSVKSSKFYQELESGIMMVGGGSLLSGLLERIERQTQLPVRIGKVNRAVNRLNSPAIYCASVGLAQKFSKRSLEDLLPGSRPKTPLDNLSHRINEWYQEYF